MAQKRWRHHRRSCRLVKKRWLLSFKLFRDERLLSVLCHLGPCHQKHNDVELRYTALFSGKNINIIEFLVKNTVGIMCVLVYNGHMNIVIGQKRNPWWGLSSLNFFVIRDEICVNISWFLLYACDNMRGRISHKHFNFFCGCKLPLFYLKLQLGCGLA